MFHHDCVPPRVAAVGSTRSFVCALFAALTAGSVAHAQSFIPPPAANIVSVQDFGAVANDGGDDLAAFQAALNVTVGTSRILYVPNGTYNFSGRLNWGGIGLGGFFTMQGQSKEGVILKLNDSAVGFTDPAAPRAFIDAYEGNTANQFRNYLRDVTIDIGANNLGAIGLEFQANNTGRIENVTIRSSDPQKRGLTGLNQGFEFPGPLLIRNLTIDGFETGYVGAPQEYSVVFENLTLRNQRTRGIYVWRLPLQIRNLVSQNSVPVLFNDGNPGASGHVVIDGGTFTGGAPGTDAISNENSGGVLILRNITTNGYANIVSDKSFSTTNPVLVPGGFVSQFTTDAPASLNATPSAILNIPIEETPDAPSIPVAQWASVKTFGAIENDNLDDTAAIQAAMNSGAPVVYFPSGLYYVSDTITVGPAVQRVEGLMSDLSLNAPLTTENKPIFRVPPGSQAIVHFSGINTSFQSPVQTGGGVQYEQATANTMVIRDGDITYRNTVPGGKLFIENLVGTNMTFTGQKVWARQLNPEGSTFTHVINDGGDLYVLGLKTEGSSIPLDNRNRARAAIMGGLIYPATVINDRTRPIVINNESSLSMSLPESCYVNDGFYAVWVRETRNGVTADFTRAMLPLGRIHSNCGGQIALYNGYVVDATPPSVPAAPTLVSNSLDSISISWPASTDAESGIARYNVYRDGIFYRATMTPALVETGLPDGTEFEYRIAAVNGAGLESARGDALNASTDADEVAPRLLGVRTGLDARFAELAFSEPLNATIAAQVSRYSVSGPAPVSVLAATPSTDGRRVVLTLSPMSNGSHTVSVTGLTDRATLANTVAPGLAVAYTYSNVAAGTGLQATYWNNRDFNGSPLLTRIDPTVNFIYGVGSPNPLVPADNFAARWTGRLRPRFNETYTLSVRSDDGSRIFLDGRLIVGNWFDQGATERGAAVTLDSSRDYDLVVEFYENGFGASVELFWQSPSQPKQIIPQSALFPTRTFTTVRTSAGVGADTNFNRVFLSDEGGGNSMGAFHSPAQGAFHNASYWRLDLSSLNLANNYVQDAVGTLSQTFFGVGDGKRLINVFAVKQAPGADFWNESGPGFVTWLTAAGNSGSGSQADADTARWMSTYFLDNTNFQNNYQPDKFFFGGPRLIEQINADTDGRLTFLAKRLDASNDGQSWFTKEWSVPDFAPALKVKLAPRCPQFLENPSAPDIGAGGALSLSALAQGAPTLTYQWFRNEVAVSDGSEGASSGGGVVSGASGTVQDGVPIALTITGAQVSDAGSYTVTITNACGNATSLPAALAITGPSRCNPADIAYDDGAPLPPVGVPGGTNNGVTEGDYNLFFARFFDADLAVDIANDDGSPLPPFGTLQTNNGVTEGDYNLFFSIFFDGCSF